MAADVRALENGAGMTKDDLVWVLIRGVGFVLLLLGLVALKDIVSALTMLYYGPPETSDFVHAMMQSARANIVTAAITALFDFGVGFYLLRRGGWLFRLLSFVPPERSNSTVERDARKDCARPSP